MKYLLDVNALIALGFLEHEFHGRVARWVRRLAASGLPELATCSITELGFVRVLAQAPQYGFTVGQACHLLQQLKEARTATFSFISDGHDISHLPRWVKAQKQITDGHLARLAGAHSAVLATLDRGIPQALVIPLER
jgi:predicted nucleic acid-binding protein